MEYPVRIDPLGSQWVVSFPDLPGATAFGPTPELALVHARQVLLVALRAAFDAGLPIPLPSARVSGGFAIELDPVATGKLLLLREMSCQGIRPATLARRMTVALQEIHRLLSFDHNSKINSIDQALRVLGRRLRVEVMGNFSPN